MDFKKEADNLLNLEYYSDNERDIVTEFARTIKKDKNPNSIKIAYNNYYSFRRNFPFYNKEVSETIENIYKKFKQP
jgi:hypothetical protein